MERQKSMHQGAFSLDDDPAFNPVLLPPRTRADVVQERPAGGTPEEVATANPGLAAAVPATVGQSGPNLADTVAAVEELNTPTTDTKTTGTASANLASAADNAGAGSAAGPAVAGAGLRGGDGSGMEVPELALQEGWSK